MTGSEVRAALLAVTLGGLTAGAQTGVAVQNESVAAAATARQTTRQEAGVPADHAQQALAAQMPVARLSHLSGSVTVGVEDGTQRPVDAALNMPLIAGSRLLTGDNGEAEVEFADGSVLRLTPGSTATLTRLDPTSQSTQLELGNGLFYMELRALAGGSSTVAAGDILVSPEENASFRIRVQDAQVETAVLAGSVSVTRLNAYTAQVTAGESVRTDPKNGRRYLLATTISPESWDNWNEGLAQAAQDQQAARTTARDGYAGAQGYGWADLDAQGRWYNVTGEGEVWQPAIADASFDPYGAGSWVYGPGGYTWASGYGWGWLPYRCGAWSFYNGFGWGWVPSSGCQTFGFGGGIDGGFEGGSGGGFRVRHPPVGWRPPQRPVERGPGTPRHPTLPVRFRPVDAAPVLPPRRTGNPVRIGGSVATPLPRIGKAITPQGGSAVGSALLRDFPVRAGTHEPVLGVAGSEPVAVPGRPAVWQRVVGADGGTARGGNGTTSNPRTGFVTGPGESAAAGYGRGRLPQPTDPPAGANGAPPLGANGAVPFGGSSAVPFGTNGTPGTTQGETLLRRGTVTGGSSRPPTSPMLPHGGVPPVQSGVTVPMPAAPTHVAPHVGTAPTVVGRPATPSMSAPAVPSAPRVNAPGPAPAAPQAAPAPGVSATPAVKSK